MKVFSAGGPVGTFAAIRRFAKIGGQIERKALLSVLFSAGAASVTLLMVCDERVGRRNRILPQESFLSCHSSLQDDFRDSSGLRVEDSPKACAAGYKS